MMTTRLTYLPLGLLAILLLTACTSDSNDAPEQPDTPQVSASTLALGMVGWGDDTRAATVSSSIQLYLASKQTGRPWQVKQGRMTALTDNEWRSVLEVKTDTTYYIYGYMPADGVGTVALSAPESGDYKEGAVISFSGLPAVTSQDICVLTGARKASEGEAKAGAFSFTGMESGNIVNLLFAHIFTTLELQIKIGTQYDQLRRIRLRSMQMTTDHSQADLTVTLTATDLTETLSAGATAPMTVGTPTTYGTAGTADITVGSDSEGLDLTTTAQSMAAFLAPSFAGTLRLVSTYDVYDKSGNLLRENCRAENRLPDMSGATAGQKKTLTLTVEPTYLYILSDPDLDSPSVTIN